MMARPTMMAAIAVLLGACNFAGTPTNNYCATTADCSGGALCDTAQHLCVSQQASTHIIFVGSPAGGRATASAMTTAVETSSLTSHDLTIQLKAPRTVYGLVQVASSTAMGAPSVPVAGTVRFVRQGATPVETPVEVQSGTSIQSADNVQYTFSAHILPGTYDVSFTPSDLAATPPYYMHSLEVTEDSAPLPLSIVYSRTGYVSGRIVDEETQIPLPNVPVRIVDAANNSRVISTIATTSAGLRENGTTDPALAGMFNLWVPDATGDWLLQIVSQSTSTLQNVTNGRLIYQVTKTALGANQSFTDLTLRADSSLSLSGAVSGSCIACVDIEASLEGTDTSGTRQSVGGATILLRSDNVLGPLPAGHTAWFEAQTTTLADGSFHVRLMPGTYAGMITPPRDAPYAVTSIRLEVTRSQRGQVIELRQLVPLVSNVVAPNGQPVAGALVEALPFVDPNITNPTAPVTSFARRAQVNTGRDGDFRMPLDEGRYILLVTPPDGSGLPSQWIVGTNIVFAPRDGSTDPTPMTIHADAIHISAPFQVVGRVIDSPMLLPGATVPPPSQSLAGATLRAFARVSLADGPVLDVEIARGLTGTDGSCTLLLPSQ